MHFLNFMFWSFWEWLALIAFMFALFRTRVSESLPQTVYICLLMSFVSYYLRNNGLTDYAPFIQVLVFLGVICLLYRIHWFHGIVAGVVGYQCYSILQGSYGIFLDYIGYVELSDINYENPKGVLILILYLSIYMMLSFLFLRKGWGFTFFFEKKNKKFVWSSYNIALVTFSVLGIFLLGATWYYYDFRDLELFYLFSLVHLLLLILMTYFTIRKEKETAMDK